jgi:hypothetical protein
MTTRRGFLGLLTGVAAATTFATRFPLLPRQPAPHPDFLTGKFVKAPEFEVGLLRQGTSEVRAHGYFRVAPSMVSSASNGVVEVQAVFPTVPGWSKAWMTRGMGLFAPKGGPLLFYQAWDTGPLLLMPGNTMQATCKFTGGEGISMYAMNKLLGLA